MKTPAIRMREAKRLRSRSRSKHGDYWDKVEFARGLRENMTEAERTLWERLQYVAGWDCQVVLRGWIVDFYNSARRLAVEIDGAIHCTTAQIKRDNTKDRSLWNARIRVMRFTNKEVLDDVHAVLEKLKHPRRAT